MKHWIININFSLNFFWKIKIILLRKRKNIYKSQAQINTLPFNTYIRLVGRHTFSEGFPIRILHVHRTIAKVSKTINGTIGESKKAKLYIIYGPIHPANIPIVFFDTDSSGTGLHFVLDSLQDYIRGLDFCLPNRLISDLSNLVY